VRPGRLSRGGTASHGRIGPRWVSDAGIIQRAPRAGCRGLPGPGAWPARGPPASTAAGSPETTLRLTDDHDRIAGELNDLVARRLLAAGLDLPGARALTGDDEARGRTQHAVSELEVAIRDIRDMVFDSRRARLPTGSRGQGRCVLLGAVQGGCAWAAGAPPAGRGPGSGEGIGGAIAERPGRCRSPGPVRLKLAGAAQDQEQG
jgi:hypothetical protein